VRMAWGTAQEGATLWALMHALPQSKLLEAGLFCVDQARLPRAWGFKPGELPPMGASPDGLLFHPGGLCQVPASLSSPARIPPGAFLWDHCALGTWRRQGLLHILLHAVISGVRNCTDTTPCCLKVDDLHEESPLEAGEYGDMLDKLEVARKAPPE